MSLKVTSILALLTLLEKARGFCTGDYCRCYDTCFQNPDDAYKQAYAHFYQHIETVRSARFAYGVKNTNFAYDGTAIEFVREYQRGLAALFAFTAPATSSATCNAFMFTKYIEGDAIAGFDLPPHCFSGGDPKMLLSIRNSPVDFWSTGGPVCGEYDVIVDAHVYEGLLPFPPAPEKYHQIQSYPLDNDNYFALGSLLGCIQESCCPDCFKKWPAWNVPDEATGRQSADFEEERKNFTVISHSRQQPTFYSDITEEELVLQLTGQALADLPALNIVEEAAAHGWDQNPLGGSAKKAMDARRKELKKEQKEAKRILGGSRQG